MQFQVWWDLFFELSSCPTWSILCHKCVLWTGATESCPFTSTWKKQWWNETNGDLAFMWGQIRNPVKVQATHWYLSWYGWLPEEACLSHLPFCLGHKSTFDGGIQTGQITSPGGLHPLHQFWTYSFLFLPFGHAWMQQSHARKVLTGRKMGCRQGWLWRVKEQKDLFTWDSHLLVIPLAWLVPWPGAIWHSLQRWDVEGWLHWLPGPRASLYGLFGSALLFLQGEL